MVGGDVADVLGARDALLRHRGLGAIRSDDGARANLLIARRRMRCAGARRLIMHHCDAVASRVTFSNMPRRSSAPALGRAGAATRRKSPGPPCRRSLPRSAYRPRLGRRNHSCRIHARDQQRLRNFEFLDQLRWNRAAAGLDAPRPIQQTHACRGVPDPSPRSRPPGRRPRSPHRTFRAGVIWSPPCAPRSTLITCTDLREHPRRRGTAAPRCRKRAQRRDSRANRERAESTMNVPRKPPSAKPTLAPRPITPCAHRRSGLALPRKGHHRSDGRHCKYAVRQSESSHRTAQRPLRADDSGAQQTQERDGRCGSSRPMHARSSESWRCPLQATPTMIMPTSTAACQSPDSLADCPSE